MAAATVASPVATATAIAAGLTPATALAITAASGTDPGVMPLT